MDPIYCYSFVEDAPSQAAAQKLLKERNKNQKQQMYFIEGIPIITRGNGELKKKCSAFLKMAKIGKIIFALADLDQRPCACDLIRDWFSIPENKPVELPQEVIFRIAIREIESWILADHTEWSKYLGIPAVNFSSQPETLKDPKNHIFDVIRKKGRRKFHKEMLPTKSSHIGPLYNEVLCDFIEKIWSPLRASKNSPSLMRAIEVLNMI